MDAGGDEQSEVVELDDAGLQPRRISRRRGENLEESRGCGNDGDAEGKDEQHRELKVFFPFAGSTSFTASDLIASLFL